MRPDVSATTERLYSTLPALYAEADETDGDWPLLRYLSLLGDQLGEVETIVDRIDYVRPEDGGDPADTSDLVDAATADAGWLAWLAQHLGVDAAGLNPAELRQAILAVRYDGGTARALTAAIRSRLSGEQRMFLWRHVDGDVWVLAAQLHPDDLTEVSWDTIEAEFPSWADIEAAGSWEGLGDFDPIAAEVVTANTPAGVELIGIIGGSWLGIESLGSWDAVEALGSWDAVELAPFAA